MKKGEEISMLLEVDGLSKAKEVPNDEIEISIQSQGRRLKIRDAQLEGNDMLRCKVPWLKAPGASDNPELSAWGNLEGGETLRPSLPL